MANKDISKMKPLKQSRKISNNCHFKDQSNACYTVTTSTPPLYKSWLLILGGRSQNWRLQLHQVPITIAFQAPSAFFVYLRYHKQKTTDTCFKEHIPVGMIETHWSFFFTPFDGSLMEDPPQKAKLLVVSICNSFIDSSELFFENGLSKQDESRFLCQGTYVLKRPTVDGSEIWLTNSTLESISLFKEWAFRPPYIQIRVYQSGVLLRMIQTGKEYFPNDFFHRTGTHLLNTSM